MLNKTVTGLFYILETSDVSQKFVHIFPTRNQRDIYFDDFYADREVTGVKVQMDYIASSVPMSKEQAEMTAEYKWRDVKVINHY